MNKKFVSICCKGFHMTFENGLTASVQWGAGNYCDNHFPEDMDFSYSKDAQSNTAEVAVFKGNRFLKANDFVPEECRGCDIVCGYMTPEQVVDFLYAVKNATFAEYLKEMEV